MFSLFLFLFSSPDTLGCWARVVVFITATQARPLPVFYDCRWVRVNGRRRRRRGDYWGVIATTWWHLLIRLQWKSLPLPPPPLLLRLASATWRRRGKSEKRPLKLAEQLRPDRVPSCHAIPWRTGRQGKIRVQSLLVDLWLVPSCALLFRHWPVRQVRPAVVRVKKIWLITARRR